MLAGLGAVALLGLLLAPLVTCWPLIARQIPWLGLPPYPLAQGIDFWGNHVLDLAGILAVALVVAPYDFWLGAAVAWGGITTFFHGQLVDTLHQRYFAFGALLYVGVTLIPTSGLRYMTLAVIATAVFQMVYCVTQWMGYDPFWYGFTVCKTQPRGTLGAVMSTALYIAVCAPLMPLFLAIPAVLVIFATHSLGPLLAVAVGFGVKGGLGWWGWFLALCGASLTLKLFAAAGRRLNKDSHYARLAVWGFAFRRWIRNPVAVLFGWGLGGWKVNVPMAQQEANWFPYNEAWGEAHNEPLQWVMETGVVGAAILGMWVWAHPGIWTNPSVMALAVGSLTGFPFHVPALALLGIVVVGLSGA